MSKDEIEISSSGKTECAETIKIFYCGGCPIVVTVPADTSGIKVSPENPYGSLTFYESRNVDRAINRLKKPPKDKVPLRESPLRKSQEVYTVRKKKRKSNNDPSRKTKSFESSLKSHKRRDTERENNFPFSSSHEIEEF